MLSLGFFILFSICVFVMLLFVTCVFCRPKRKRVAKPTYIPPRDEVVKMMRTRGFQSTVVGSDRGNPAKIFFKIFGRGKRRIVLCMGLGARGDLWKSILPELFESPFIQLLVIDNRGIGQSDAQGSSCCGMYSIPMMAQDTADVINAVGWHEFHLVGHSMGGMVASEVALLCPSRILSLSLFSTHMGGWKAIPTAWCIWTQLQGVIFPSKILEHVLVNNMKLLQGSIVHQDPELYREIISAKIRDKSRFGKNGSQSFWCFLRQLLAISQHSIPEDRLHPLQSTPCLIISGDEDHLISHENSRWISRALDSSRLIVLKGSGHTFQRERPKWFVKTLLDFTRLHQARRPNSNGDSRAMMSP
ncbi:hypothetical protein AAMO2058_000302200 [Amorphochlora amoebiformis]